MITFFIVSFSTPNLQYDGQIDTVFILKFESLQKQKSLINIQPIKALVSYTLKGNQDVYKEISMRIDIVGNNHSLNRNDEVLIEYYRIKAARVLKKVSKLADDNRLNDARDVLNEFENRLSNCEVKNDIKIKELIADITESKNRLVSKFAWDQGGRAQIVSLCNAHLNKVSLNNCLSYVKPLQTSLSIKIQEYVSDQMPKPDLNQFNSSKCIFNLPLNSQEFAPNQIPRPYPTQLDPPNRIFNPSSSIQNGQIKYPDHSVKFKLNQPHK